MTIDQVLHKLRTAFLGLVLALSLFMPESTWADSFITDVILVGGTSDEVSKAKSSNSDYTFINFDLNSKAGGDYIYLGYKTSASANLNGGYITDFIIIDAGSSKSPPSSLTYNSLTYYRTSAYGGSHFRNVYGNLNSNSGGWNLYLYYTWSNFSDKRAVSSISINSTKSGSINAYNTSGSLKESEIDLNRGIEKSTDVYMHIYTSTKKHRLSSAPVMASGLVYNGQPQRLIKTAASSSGTVYYKVGSGSYTSTVSSITATSAGSYTVYYYVGSNSYADASGEQSKTVTIAKSPNSSVSVYIASTLYADQAISPSISGTNLSKGSITYKYATSQNGSYSTTKPFGEGTYWVKATISGDDNCYEYTTSPRRFSVIKRQNNNVTVNITSSVVYGETLNPTVTGNQSTGSVTYMYATSQDGSYSTTKPKGVGTYWVKATIASNSYYYEYTTSARSFEITPKEINITWGEQTSFVYNGSDQAPTATAGSLVSGDECLITVQGAKDVGKQTATATALSNGNYKLPADVEKPFEIVPKEINIIWGEQTSFVYNGTDQAPTATAGSLVAGDECIITVSGAEKNVGKHIATATALSNGNYKLPEDVKKSFEITKAPLTISAKNKKITYGDKPADNGVEYSGFVGEDDASVLGGTLMFSTDYEQNGPVGEYAITPSNLTSDNYEIEFVNGSLTVEPKEVSIAWGDALLHYNGTEQAPTATAEGLVNGDKCSVVVSGAAKDIGKYSAFVTGLSNNNYKLPTENLEMSFEIAINLAALNENFIAQDGYVLKGALGGNYKVSIAEGATVTLDGVTINGVNNFAYKWAGITCVGDCNIVLAENSVNTVKGFDCDYPGIYVPEGKTLTISGPGSLDASSNGQGAGIGGGWRINCGNIVISGGSVKSTGGSFAAGIGGGNHGSVGNITISGGTVESTGGTDAAGIGGGYHGSVNDITISGGVVAATGGECGAGIGSGYNSSVESVTISGGSVKSTGGSLASGIGSGDNGTVGNITITDDVVKVTATKGSSAQYSVGVGDNGSRTGIITIGGKESEDIKTSPFVYLRKLTVTAKNKTIVYGDEPSDNGVEYAGFLDGDDLSVLSGTLSLSTDYKRNGSVGDYFITPFGLTSDKYNVVFESGMLTVEPKEVSIVWGEQTSFVYNGTEQAPTATVEGLVDGDECSVTVSGAAKDFGKHTATASVSCSDNYKLPTENLEKAFEIAYTNLALLNADYIAQDGEVLTETLTGNYKISIADGATVTLDGVTIKGEDDEAYSWAGITCEGDCNIVLAEKSVNKVNGFYKNYPGIYVPEGKTLTISGTGSIDASSNGAGAGIGCGYDINCGNIVISDGSVTATGGGYASGIGSGEESTAGSITLTENVTKVTAIKGDNAIFSVYSGGLTETVTIGSFKTICVASSPFVFTGEAYTVVYDANGGDGTMGKQVLYFGLADILYANKFTRDGFSFVGWNTKADGSGESYTDKALIDIAAGADGVVTLYAQWWNGNLLTLASDYIAQDGDVLTGTLGGNYQISIADGATVTLDGVTINGVDDDAYRWAGISCLGDCNIVLAEKSVNTVKGFYRNYPGIYVPKGGTLTISGSGSLNVSSNGNAAGIGGGLDFWCGNIVIGGGTITAMGGEGAAGIGGGHGFECGNIVISGGSITATGGEGASGIGSGDNGTVGNITITDGVTKVIATKGDDASSVGAGYYGTRTGTITIGGKEYEDDISESPFVYPTTIAEYPAAKIYEYSSGIRAIINADYTGKETLSVPTPIEVDSVEVKRSLTPLTPATTVLPFTLPEGTTLNARFYYVKAVEQVGCSWNATMKYIGTGKLPEANTPYAIILNKGESNLKFDMHGKQATVQTGDIADKVDETGKWYFKGLYSYRVWRDTDKGEDNEIGLAYGFAGSNEDGVAKGEFGRIVDGAYAVPMRSYLRKKDASVRLNCAVAARAWGAGANNAGIANANANVITVNFVEDDENGEERTTAVGHLNSVTGEFKIDRWYDLKGRRINNVNRAVKGAYYGKKVLKK